MNTLVNQLQKLPPLACVILAAGQGTRMCSNLPKVLHPIACMPMIKHVVSACEQLSAEKIIAVVAPNVPAVIRAVEPYQCVEQTIARGTGDAVRAAQSALQNFTGDILVLFGDTPLVTGEALKVLRTKRLETGAAIVVVGFTPDDAASYGRLVLDNAGKLAAIVEVNDATAEQKQIRLCNGGIMLFDAAKLWPLLAELKPNNAKNEYYLTDCIALARAKGWDCVVAELDPENVLGINTRVELAEAEQLMQQRLRRQMMLSGVTMQDPETVYLCADTQIGQDTVIGANVVFGPGVTVAPQVEIRAFCHLEQVRVEKAAKIGPFARLRPGTVIGADAHIGNFVETKNTEVSAGAKINHLSYIGDAFVGEKANIGAGTITCNYDGFRKTHTHIGAEAFIGSNSALVAPVKIGDGAYVGAGSVITMEVPANTLAVARGRQSNIEDWARRYREAQKKSD